MTDEKRIALARAELRESYTIAGQQVKFLASAEYAMGYDPETDKLGVVLRKDPLREIHIIPMSNVKGMTSEAGAPVAREKMSPAEQQAHRRGNPSPKERDTAAHGPSSSLSTGPELAGSLTAVAKTAADGPAVAEVTSGRPAPAGGAGGGSRRARPPQ